MQKLALLLFLFAACTPRAVTPSPDASDASMPNPPDSAAPPAGDACAQGEATLLALKCTDSRGRLLGGPNEHGVPWSQICRNNAAAGVDMKPACLAVIKSCSEVPSCR